MKVKGIAQTFHGIDKNITGNEDNKEAREKKYYVSNHSCRPGRYINLFRAAVPKVRRAGQFFPEEGQKTLTTRLYGKVRQKSAKRKLM